MGFLDGIAALGLAGRGFDETDRRIRDRDWQQEERERQRRLNEMALAEAVRRDELARGLRETMANVPRRAAARGLDITTPVENDPYGEGYVRTERGFDQPEGGVDLQATTRAAADYLAGKGEIEASEKYRKALKQMEDEGFKDVIVGVAAGKNPAEIAKEFNALGEKRIVGGTTDGKTYRFKYEDGTEATYQRDQMRELAQQFGFLKKPDLHNVPAGSTVLRDGKPVYTAPAKETPRNIDPLSPEGIEAATRRAEAVERARANARPEKPPKPRNWTSFDNGINAAASDIATSTDPVTGKKAVDYETKGQIRALAQQLARSDPEAYESPAAAVDAAREQLDALRADIAARVQREISENPGAPKAYGQTPEDYTRRRVSELTKRALHELRGGKPAAKEPAKPAAEKPKPAGYRTSDGKVLPEGTRVRNKKTGTVQQVVNGELVDVTDYE